MPLDNAFAKRQPNAGSRILGVRVQPLEELEYSVAIFRVYADAVITHSELCDVPLWLRADVNVRRFRTPKLDGIAYQILE